MYGRIHGCFFSHAGDYGIHLNGNIRHTKITQTEIDGATSDGIRLEGTTVRNNVIERTVAIYASGGYGINLIAPATRNIIHAGASLYDNALGDLSDGGTLTEFEEELRLLSTTGSIWNAQTADYQEVGSTGEALGSGGGSDVDAIWDELTSSHQIPGSTGKALTDAGAGGNPWGTILEGNNTAGTFGYLLQTTFVGYFNTIINKIQTTFFSSGGKQANQK